MVLDRSVLSVRVFEVCHYFLDGSISFLSLAHKRKMVSRDSIPAVINSVPKIVPTSANLEKVVSSSKIPSLSKGQNLRINPEVHQLRTEVARLTPPVGQFIISTVLNVLGFAAAIAFGVFAVRSVSLAIASNNAASRANDLASVANDQSIVANRVALISYCSSTKDVGHPIQSTALIDSRCWYSC